MRSTFGGSEDNTPASAVSVYHPFALVELLGYVESDESEETGDVLLIFEDQADAKCRSARPETVESLAKRLLSAPNRNVI